MPYGVAESLWSHLPLDERQAIIVAAGPPPPPPPPTSPPPRSPDLSPPAPTPAKALEAAGTTQAAADAARLAAHAAAVAGLVLPPEPPGASTTPKQPGGLSGADLTRIVTHEAQVLDTIPPAPQGDAGADVEVTADVEPTPGDWPDPDGGDADFTLEALQELEQDALAFEQDPERTLAAVSHPRPGTIIGTPFVGTHSRATNCEPPPGPSCNWESMNAVDIWLYPGTHILAVEDGVISPGGWGYGQSASGGRFAGWRVHLVGQSHLVFFYTHMNRLAVAKGARVRKGQLIGYSGVANGVPHLHFAVNPPANPAHFAPATYNVHARTPIAGAVGSVGAEVPIPAAHRPAGVIAQWRELVDVFKLTVPKQSGRVDSIAGSLREVFK